jgi:hypothetical protein
MELAIYLYLLEDESILSIGVDPGAFVVGLAGFPLVRE